MDQSHRIEEFLFRAIWIIMWMLLRHGIGTRDDEARILKWRHDYYNAGGGTIEAPPE